MPWAWRARCSRGILCRVYAVLTKKMAEAMVISTLLAMILLHGANFLTGAVNAFYATLSSSSYQFVLLEEDQGQGPGQRHGAFGPGGNFQQAVPQA